MDPVTILDYAASVAQFVDFALELLWGLKEIENTVDESPGGNVWTLDKIHAQLRDISSTLELSSQKNAGLKSAEGTSQMIGNVFAINELSASCKVDCDRLSEIVGELRARNSTNARWQYFAYALGTVWTNEEVRGLSRGLRDVQTVLNSHICTLSRYWQSVFELRLLGSRKKTGRFFSSQSTRFDDLTRGIFELGRRAEEFGSWPTAKVLGHSDIKSLQAHLCHLATTENNLEKQHKILNSLNFESRPMRYSSLADAHHGTFQWVFAQSCNHDAEVAFNNLIEWLQRGDGFFWVSGKPGSGKSTLMKFITDHPQTLEALSMWSHPGPPIIARHSFWSAGTGMQKSWQGLLQTLLFEIFRQRPDLIEIICVEKWSKTTEQLDHEKWHLTELRMALQRIADCENLSIKICFFIDGLDEFEGDHLTCCHTLRDLSKSNHIKFCVSSRPWTVFEQSFGQSMSSKLYMHQLTRSDIESYARNTLQGYHRWVILDMEVKGQIIYQITERAMECFYGCIWSFDNSSASLTIPITAQTCKIYSMIFQPT